VSRGLTFRAYCYNAIAENTWLLRLSDPAVADFVRSEEWVDLLAVWRSALITGGASGLKTVAALAGYTWPVEDPGGEDSMAMHDAAIGVGPDAEAARAWLLAYNEGDVRATLALREWMSSYPFEPIELLEPE
jgi:predicted RecB family nuclease